MLSINPSSLNILIANIVTLSDYQLTFKTLHQLLSTPPFQRRIESNGMYLSYCDVIKTPTIPIPLFRFPISLRNLDMDINCHWYSSMSIFYIFPFPYKNTRYHASITYSVVLFVSVRLDTLVIERIISRVG